MFLNDIMGLLMSTNTTTECKENIIKHSMSILPTTEDEIRNMFDESLQGLSVKNLQEFAQSGCDGVSVETKKKIEDVLEYIKSVNNNTYKPDATLSKGINSTEPKNIPVMTNESTKEEPKPEVISTKSNKIDNNQGPKKIINDNTKPIKQIIKEPEIKTKPDTSGQGSIETSKENVDKSAELIEKSTKANTPDPKNIGLIIVIISCVIFCILCCIILTNIVLYVLSDRKVPNKYQTVNQSCNIEEKSIHVYQDQPRGIPAY